MRVVICLVLLAISSSSALAQTEDETGAWWRSLPENHRQTIQSDLVLLGYYDGFVDGKFGPLTKEALGRYQLSEGVTGAVPPAYVLESLRSRALDVYVKFGFALEKHPRDGVAALVPRSILTKTLPSDDGGMLFANDDEGIVLHLAGWDYPGVPLAKWAPGLLKAGPNQTITYRSIRDDQLVISGRQDGAAYYSLLAVDYPKVIGLTVSWVDEYATEGAIIATFVASYSGATERLEQIQEPSELVPQSVEPWQSVLAQMDGQRFGSFLLPTLEPKAIALVDEIGLGTVLEFRRALKARPDATTLLLDSVGGSVNEGLLLAHEVADQKLSTFVPKDAGCYSACAYVFFAGHARSATGDLGVHQIYGADVSASDAQTVLSDVLEALDEFDVPQEVISVMLRTRPDQMHVFSKDEKELLKLNRGELNVGTLTDRKVNTVKVPPLKAETSEQANLQTDTLTALLADPANESFQFVGVWARAQTLCQKVDTLAARDFAIITRSTYRDGAKTYYGNFGGLVGAHTTLNAKATSDSRVLRLKQWSANVISIDEMTMVRCSLDDMRPRLDHGL